MFSAYSTIFWLSLYYYYLTILKSLLFLILIIFQDIISFKGKVKEKSFDALTNSTMLKSDWISQSSATQVRAIFPVSIVTIIAIDSF